MPHFTYAGGNFVSSYDWKHTIGERDLRPPIYDPVWHAVQSNDVGVDELLQLCELIGSEPFGVPALGLRSRARALNWWNISTATPTAPGVKCGQPTAIKTLRR